MALVTSLRGHDVIGGFKGRGLNAATLSVTGRAFFRRALKGPLNMAGFTRQRRMRSGQRKTGFDVIKIYIAFSGRG